MQMVRAGNGYGILKKFGSGYPAFGIFFFEFVIYVLEFFLWHYSGTNRKCGRR
jgi:hypothetical protein